MPKYRLHVYNAEEKLIAPPMVISADNDRAAIEQAETMLDGVRVELWDGDRFHAPSTSVAKATRLVLGASRPVVRRL